MSVTPSFTVTFVKEAFTPGETIQGELLISTPVPIDISGIYLQLQGFERVRFRQRATDTSSSPISEILDWEAKNGKTVNTAIPTILPITQPHFIQSVLICLTVAVTKHRDRLQIGLHSFPFTVSLPSKLPPSLNFASGSKYSADIEYTLYFQVFSGKSNHHPLLHTTPVKVSHCPQRQSRFKHVFPFLDQRITISHALCFCLPAKELNFLANWTRNTFHPGQEAELILRLSLAHGSGSCKLKHVSVKLVRELVLSVDGQSFRTVDPIAKTKFPVEGTPLSDATAFELCTAAQLQIPANLEPTTTTSSIDCRYFFVFEVDFKRFESILLASEVIVQ